ncbi:type III-A CRISPR-associated RAMP protein Csm4 [Thioflexithrix psekupsensis]|uniref:CRISPR system Cms protein Csm4 n=1 Tax=Thioflexithrix psekupsensis TaxID=1570016 RepID=A0A251X8G5_9GAMM|nr:hypothetical protein [Thioflexithrix psekupsensis]OUD14215.1 hypothetical protein TPSD3_07750 [Thioflexithrix psekupsensis]
MNDLILVKQFRLSSAFPKLLIFDYKTQQEKIFYFLPRAVKTSAIPVDKKDSGSIKKMKKIKWIESSLYFASLTERFWQADNLDEMICNTEFILPADQIKQLPSDFKMWKESDNTRVAIDRLTAHSSKGILFEFARLFYADFQQKDVKNNPVKHFKSGLYFFVRFNKPNDTKTQKKFRAVLDLLGDSGIGADRSSGHGLFSAKMMPSHLPFHSAKTNQPAIALSLCAPSQEECYRFFEKAGLEKEKFMQNAAYELVKRGGWIAGSGHRKQTLRLFAEGSYFHTPLEGDIIDVTNTPDYSALRDARGFFIGVPN